MIFNELRWSGSVVRETANNKNIEKHESTTYPQILLVVGRKVCYDKLRQDPDCFSWIYTPLEGEMGENWGQKSPILGLKLQESLNYLPESDLYPQILVFVGRKVCYDKLRQDHDWFS